MCRSDSGMTVVIPRAAQFRARDWQLVSYQVVQPGQATQAAQVVIVEVTLVQICTPAAPLPETVHNLMSCSMHGQLELPVLSL